MSDLSHWKTRDKVTPLELSGKLTRLTHFNYEVHTEALWNAFGKLETNHLIRYFPDGPFEKATEFGQWLDNKNKNNEFHTMIISAIDNKEILGMASYMRCSPEHGSVEIGSVAHGSRMARSTLATEAHYLLAKYIFDDLGYRRYEWKLNNENEASHKAAKRLGFVFEGVFRQHRVAKGKNRDTAWYSMLDSEWPINKAALEVWLGAKNFDITGRQIKSLERIRFELSA